MKYFSVATTFAFCCDAKYSDILRGSSRSLLLAVSYSSYQDPVVNIFFLILRVF